jgi:meso-butanediol dehydrogenase / (S,S)-butanediol dehydrogenase / diacetyl reductase
MANPRLELEGQVAIVTGAGRGIGRAVATELADDGAAVVVADLDKESAEATAEELREAGPRTVGIGMDVTRAADRLVMVDRALEAFGRIDILVNNAGIYREMSPMEITEDHWDEIIGVNAKSVVFCSQAVLPTMLAGRGGAIVNVASIAAKGGAARGMAYAASKAAVISITSSLAKAHARNGIRVNCVCPGFVDTDMWAMIDHEVGVEQLGKQPRELWNELTATIPLGRPAQPVDVARVVCFLASPRAGYMTGQAVNVTGGLIMH